MSKGLRQRHSDEVYMKCLFMSDEPVRWAEASSVVDEEQGTGDVPASQQAVQLRSHKRVFMGHQTDVASFQVQPSVRSTTPGDGVMRWHHWDGVYDRHSNMNNKYKEKLTNLSVRLQERSTTLYSLAKRPKAPDKGRQQAFLGN
jgi:hypothetical protein